jgi:hypothetical protein
VIGRELRIKGIIKGEQGSKGGLEELGANKIVRGTYRSRGIRKE